MLMGLFKRNMKDKTVTLRSKLFDLKYSTKKSFKEYVDEYLRMVEILKNYGDAEQVENYMRQFLNSLP